MSKILFLSVPQSIRDLHFHTHDDFKIDFSKPIPVEVSGEQADSVKEALENLSIEAIIAAMLKVLSDDPAIHDAAYYREFVLAFKPNILSEFSTAALAKAENGGYAMAEEIISALKGLFPNSSKVRFLNVIILEQQAESLERSGREEESKALDEIIDKTYTFVLSSDEILPESMFNAGFFYMKIQNYARAAECFRGFIEISNDTEKNKKAKSILAEIKKRNLDDILFYDAYCLIRDDSEESGMEKLRQFLEKNTNVWNSWFMLGWALRRLGRWKEGAESFRKALEFGGENPDTHNELAICLMESGDYKAAKKELEMALRDEPENVKIISNLGVLALKEGDKQRAASFFRAVLEIEPDDPLALEFLK